jgi:hypothetical protein
MDDAKELCPVIFDEDYAFHFLLPKEDGEAQSLRRAFLQQMELDTTALASGDEPITDVRLAITDEAPTCL